MAFTFKKAARKTGLASVGEIEPAVKIKLNGKEIGYISPVTHRSDSRDRRIFLAVKQEPTKDDPAPFRWVCLTSRMKDETEARAFLSEWHSRIVAKYDLYQFED